MKKVLLGCLGVAVLGGVACAFLAWWYIVLDRPTLQVSLAVEPEVNVGVPFAMTVTATNTTSAPITLDSVDVDDSLLRGFQVLSIVPQPRDTVRVGLISQRSWSFGTAVPAGGSISITFNLKPLEKGHFTGDVDVCNPYQDFVSVLADVVVR